MKKVNWLITDHNITVNYDGQTHIVSRQDELADRLIKAVKENKLSEIPMLVSTAKRVEAFSQGTFQVRDGEVFIKGVAVPAQLSKKIVKFSNEGLPYQPLLKFAENLQQNPSFRAVNELFTFLEKNNHPITENGCFIAYKRVRKDFLDIHSGTMDNSVGSVVEMPRNQVNEDSTQTCSAGLHVANWTYAHTQFASHDPATDVMLEVEVNPADVVSVPVDYNNAKMRTCKYTVLGVVDKEHSSDVQLRRVHDEPETHCHEGCCDEDEEEEEEESGYCAECSTECDPSYALCEDCEIAQEDAVEETEEADPGYWREELDE
jgi:hypothetical protein